MDFEDVLERFDEGTFSLFILGGTLLGAAVVQWATRFYRQVSLQIGNASSDCGLAGQVVAARLLAACGLSNIPVKRGGQLNYYHPWRREILLRPDIFDSPSLSALAVAAHEVGHAQQFASSMWLCRLRNVIWPVCFALPVIGLALLLLGLTGWIDLPEGSVGLGALIICCVTVVAQLPINLPLERDASRRAAELVRKAGMIGDAEQLGFDRLLQAAWLTHAAVEARRWIMLAVVVILTAFVPSFFGLAPDDDFQPPVETLITEAPEEAYVVGPNQDLLLPAMWELALGIVPLVLLLAFATRLHKAAKQKPTVSEQAVLRNNAGSQLNEQGDRAGSIREYTEALRLDPALMAAYFNRGAAYFSLGKFDEALADFEAALRLAPRFADAILGRGNARFLRTEFDLAMADFDEALRLVPESALAWFYRGNVWKAREDYDRAIADFNAAIERDPKLSDAYRDRGLTRYFQGDCERAVADLNEALRLNRRDPLTFNNRGCALLKLGEYRQAGEDFRDAIHLEPQFPNSYRHLAWLQSTCPEAEFRNGEQAVANATRALELTVWKRIDWLEALAAAHAEAGNFAEAVKWQQKFVDDSPAEKQTSARNRLDLYQNQQAFRDHPAAELQLAESR